MSQLPATRPDREAKDWCPGCDRNVPLEQFERIGEKGVHPFDDVPELCNACWEEFGKDSGARGPKSHLTFQQRRVIKMVLQGKSTNQIARALGMKPPNVSSLLSGRDQPQVRRAMVRLMEMNGLTLPSLARKLGELFDATRPSWNKKSEEWDFHPDNHVQLGVVRHVTRMMELEPPNVREFSTPRVQVNIQTNLGEGGSVQEHEIEGNTYTIEAEVENPGKGGWIKDEKAVEEYRARMRGEDGSSE